jgi:hypothetical protein
MAWVMLGSRGLLEKVRTILFYQHLISARAVNRMALWAWALCVTESLDNLRVRFQRRDVVPLQPGRASG